MKRFFALLVLFTSVSALAQTSVNDYQFVVIPSRFEVQSDANQYRLNTLSKKYLLDAGFNPVHETMMTDGQINHRCDHLYMDVLKVKSMLTVKVKILFRDCRNNIIFESAEGRSKEKDYEKGYQEALKEAFESVKQLGYAYNGKNSATTVSVPQNASVTVTPTQPAVLQAEAKPVAARATGAAYTVEALASGYLIIDAATSRIALKIMKTSDPKIYTASRNGESGVFINKGGKWFFEYYKDEKLYSEEFKVDYNF